MQNPHGGMVLMALHRVLVFAMGPSTCAFGVYGSMQVKH